MNIVEFSKQLAGLVREHATKAVDACAKAFDEKLAELSTRVKAMEDRPAPADGKDGRDGQDAPAPTVEQLRHAVIEAPQLADMLSQHVSKHLSDNPPAAGKDGEPGRDGEPGAPGKDAPAPSMEMLREAWEDAYAGKGAAFVAISHSVAAYMQDNPPPAGKDGEPGEPGEDAPAPTPEVVIAALQADPTLLATAVAAHLTANPPPAGQDGAAGRDGQDAPAPTAETVAAALAAHPELLEGVVASYMQQHPPRDGKDVSKEELEAVVEDRVLSYMSGSPSQAMELAAAAYLKDNPPPAGKDGQPGRDGTSVSLEDITAQLANMQASWALDFERRAMELFHNVVSKMQAPRDGKDGVDGLGFDDMSVEYDGQRLLKLVFMRGDNRKEFSLRVPAIIHRGIFKKDATYEEGDAVTWGGSMWLAKTNTVGNQPGTHASWQLVVKHGRDGKDAT